MRFGSWFCYCCFVFVNIYCYYCFIYYFYYLWSILRTLLRFILFLKRGCAREPEFCFIFFLLLLFFVQITKSKQTTRRHEAEDTGLDYTLQLLLLSQAIHPCHPSIHLLVRRLSDDERRATEHCSLMVRFHKHFKPVDETRVVVQKTSWCIGKPKTQ